MVQQILVLDCGQATEPTIRREIDLGIGVPTRIWSRTWLLLGVCDHERLCDYWGRSRILYFVCLFVRLLACRTRSTKGWMHRGRGWSGVFSSKGTWQYIYVLPTEMDLLEGETFARLPLRRIVITLFYIRPWVLPPTTYYLSTSREGSSSTLQSSDSDFNKEWKRPVGECADFWPTSEKPIPEKSRMTVANVATVLVTSISISNGKLSFVLEHPGFW